MSQDIDVAVLKNKFLDKLSRLQVDSSSFHPDFQPLAELWNDTMQSAWTSIWIRGESCQKPMWQKVSVAPDDYVESPQPNGLEIEHGPSVEYAHRFQSPVFILDQANWKGEIDGRIFQVLGKDDYEEMGSPGFLMLPFPKPLNSDGGREQLRIRGALCCHFKSLEQLQKVRDVFTDEDLVTLVRMTATHIRAIIAEQHFQVLVRLNKLASGFLTKITKNPRQDRMLFLNGVAQLVGQVIGSKAVSIFYRTTMTDEVACIYSDGLCGIDGKKIPNAGLFNCRYEPGEKKTGLVYKTGERIVLGAGDARPDDQKYVELIDGKKVVNDLAILEPIPVASSDVKNKYGSEGVIRCVGRKPGFSSLERYYYNDLEAQAVRFIASQIAPVLKTLAVRIQREDQVNIVRHELLVPSRMIMDSVVELQDILKGQDDDKSPINEYLLPDLAVASTFLKNLILQLDAEPGALTFSPRKTYLRGEIIARNTFMLEHYAKTLREMTIQYRDLERVLPALMVDPELVERTFFNVVMNAIKYGRPGTEIKISARADSSAYYLDVSNEGVGINEKDEEKIFHRYYRAAKKKKVEGVGLGLYISKAAMEKTGGALVLTKAKNPTIFSLVFPRSLGFTYGGSFQRNW